MEDKFLGCMVGGLVGDCLGGPFEDQHIVPVDKLQKFFAHLISSTREGQHNYTDDTAMAWNMLDSLFEKNGYDPKDMSTKFSSTYFKESFRYYGGHVTAIFAAWKKEGLVDVYSPARMQFEGTGSFGNGGAMRIAPIALYHYKNWQEMDSLATLTTKLTHYHPIGIIGALIQCWAVRLALDEDPSQPLNADKFISQLQAHVKSLKGQYEEKNLDLYLGQLEKLKEYLKRETVVVADVVNEFGNTLLAQESVATALYCFLRCTRPVHFIQAENGFERAIQLAIAMGGDTDTIACMAGSIAGSYYGFKLIPVHLSKCCEKLEKALQYGKDLHSRMIKD